MTKHELLNKLAKNYFKIGIAQPASTSPTDTIIK